MPGTIALLTDFGLADPYVGTMKGVIQAIAPGTTVIDLSHAVRPHNVAAAALTLADAYRYFPQQTVHVAVVDPGVGTSRRLLAACAYGQTFLAPDNGLLHAALGHVTIDAAYAVENTALFLNSVSRTFHGRDCFAPVAAHLATGQVKPADLGPPAPPETWFQLSLPSPTKHPDGSVSGCVTAIDHFGNLLTNIPASLLPSPITVEIKGQLIRRLSQTYADAEDGKILALVGSNGRLEIAANGHSAAHVLNAHPNDPVLVAPNVS